MKTIASLNSEIVKIGDITTHKSGNSKLIKGKLFDEPADGRFPAYSASGQDVWAKDFEHEGEAIVVSAVGARCGKCFLASGKWSAIANTHVVWPKPEKVLNKFLWYLLNDEKFWIRSGSAQPFVTVRKTFEKSIALPTLKEQREIVSYIEETFSTLEAGIAALKRVQSNLKRYRAAVLKAACEGRLVETEAALAKREGRTFESGQQLLNKILSQRKEQWQGKSRFKEAAGSHFKKQAILPSGWCHATLEQICVKVTDGTHFSPENSPEGDFKYITSKNVREFKLDLSNITYVTKKIHDEIYAGCDVKKNDVLYVKDGANTGLAAKNTLEEPFSLLSSVGLFRTVRLVEPDYLVAYLNNEEVRNRMLSETSGVAITRLTLTKLNATYISVPPIAEQRRIVAELYARLTDLDSLTALVEANLLRSRSLRQSILQTAFSGDMP